jgi:hypothetical protein
MGNCSTFFDELRFDVRDPGTTHVYAFFRGEGDCPHTIHGWHHKAFPSSLPSLDIVKLLYDGEENPMVWEREAPSAMREAAIFNPHDHVPVPAHELIEWWSSLVDGGTLTPIEIADAITARLTMSPHWHKACPYCRAQDMMMQAQMAPPQ